MRLKDNQIQHVRQGKVIAFVELKNISEQDIKKFFPMIWVEYLELMNESFSYDLQHDTPRYKK